MIDRHLTADNLHACLEGSGPHACATLCRQACPGVVMVFFGRLRLTRPTVAREVLRVYKLLSIAELEARRRLDLSLFSPG